MNESAATSYKTQAEQYRVVDLPRNVAPVAATNLNTIVGEYEPIEKKNKNYQSEAALEAEFIEMLTNQGYEYLNIHCEQDLIANLRCQLERLNSYKFSDEEWQAFFRTKIANSTECGETGIVPKTRKIQEDNVQVLDCDDGSHKNITIIDKTNIQKNYLQVINQYEIAKEQGAKHDNRYDVTILVNGLPLVHVELKKRGRAIKEAFNQIERYQRDSFWASTGLYEYVQIFVISNGTNTKYYSNTTRLSFTQDKMRSQKRKSKTSNSFEFTSFWADGKNRIIPDLVDFTRTFFARQTILNILCKYCIFTSENKLMVMRPYQIMAVECILNRIEYANNKKLYGKKEGGGYIWHTTGSGKTLTSFKTARIASGLNYIDKVLFVVDRKDLDYQTMREYDRFEKNCANSNKSTSVLKRQLEDSNAHIIITTIQKLSIFIEKNPKHEVFNKHVVLMFDECHRSQFGDMHKAIVKNFKKYHLFGFTGTPIFTENAPSAASPGFFTTKQTFGDCLHTYNIVDAINDKNVLPFRVDYIKTIAQKDDISDEQVWDIEREETMLKPKRIELVTKYILEHFDQKTYSSSGGTYDFSKTFNVEELARDKSNSKVKAYKENVRLKGFNSIFAVSSINAAIKYYQEFKRQMLKSPAQSLKIAMIYSYSANDEEKHIEALQDGILGEENCDDTSQLSGSARDFLDSAIKDYNQMFQTNYSTDGDSFQNYYKDVSMRMKNKEIDLLIVVNMFLTGFDATTLNTLWVDKNLKMHGLIQAFSRTNRILNNVKTFGNIVCFRNLSKQVDEAIARFGNKDDGGVVLLRSFKDYYEGYTDKEGQFHPGYLGLLDDLLKNYPLSEPSIEGDENQKTFISLFGAILRMRNLLSSFDEFDGNDGLCARDFQDYLSRYQDLREEWKQKREKGELENIEDDVVFEIDIIKSIDINIDYILMLVEKYRDEQGKDKEVLVSIMKSVESSTELRSKKQLIEAFIKNLNDVEDVSEQWQEFIAKRKEEELAALIKDLSLNDDLTRKFIDDAFYDGEVKTYGTEIEALMPKMSLFGNSGREEKKRSIINALKGFFERYFGVSA